MRKLLMMFFVLFTLNAYSQYDDLYYDGSYDGYHTTTYLTYNHFPNYSARINFFYGSGIYFTWSLFNYYWYTPYYSWYYPSWNYYSWYYPNYYNWNNNYYTYNHHHHNRRFKNNNTYYGHRSRMSSNTNKTVYKPKPIKTPTTTHKVVKTPTKVVHTVKNYNKPNTVTTNKTVRSYQRPQQPKTVVKHYTQNKPNTTRVRSNTTYQRPRSSTYNKPTRTYTQNRPNRSYRPSTPSRNITPRRKNN